jgi:cation diffusion facilitator family transporter
MKKEGVTTLSIVVNVFLTLGKLIIGAISMSSAILAEGIHSGMDIITSIISYWGIRISKKPMDKEHPYGHHQGESIAGFTITIILFLSAVYIIYEAVIGFSAAKILDVSYIAFAVMGVSAAANFVMSELKMRHGKKYESMALIADANHSRMDVYTSIGVFIGLIVSGYWIYADSVAAILIGLYIMHGSLKLGKKTTDSLLNMSADDEIEAKIRDTAKKEGVNLWGLKTQKLGSDIFAEMKIGLDPKLNVEDATKISHKLESRLKEAIPQLKHIVMQIESHKIKESFYEGGFGKMQWRGRMGGFGMGPSGDCVCTKCGHKVPHERGVPCYKMKCPKCGAPMARSK